MAIKLDLCQYYDYCQSAEDAKKWLDGRNINVLLNRIRFDPTKFGEESII